MREARRQLQRPDLSIPEVVVLDPDGDLCDYLRTHRQASHVVQWACYHSQMYAFELEGQQVGIIPRAVGAAYAVLVAEQLFVSGCQLLISITSAGIVREPDFSQSFVLITEAVRDEGTSYHYLPADAPAALKPSLFQKLIKAVSEQASYELMYAPAKAWTTDAPYRETQQVIDAMATIDVTCVEMESAALYALGIAKNYDIVCFAHLTNTMAQQEGDFEKGEFAGSLSALTMLEMVVRRLRPYLNSPE
ncbi:MAG: nucleoside phosphorylase [Bacteroidota bacterium]